MSRRHLELKTAPEDMPTGWGEYASAANLPNVSGSNADDNDLLRKGDTATVDAQLYICTVPAAGGATWRPDTPLTGEAWVWPAFRPAGDVALTGIGTSVTADAATSIYYTDIGIRRRMTCTGVALLAGTVVTTDNATLTLHDSAGAVVISTASYDVTGFTADVFGQVPWTAVQTLNPGRYFVSVAVDGTTFEFQCLAATQPITICEKETGHVYATPSAIASIATASTAFTADVAPIFYLY